MNHRVHITDKALADAESVVVWFQEQKAAAAGRRWFSALWKTVDTLESHPERCPSAAEAEDVGREVRELLFGGRRGQYRILFEIRGRTVYILRIWHSARDAFTISDL
ncbi:MAG: type II toxin-antitoxin system RelE/ParE family toxin [Planctomycetia bacterium]